MTPAQNGKIAVDLFMKSEENSFDAIFMDIMMPEMNGYDATRTIRAMRRADAAAVPILAMTANAFDEDKRKAAEAGMNAHISKPIEFPVLLAELGRLTGSKHDAKS